MESRLASDEYEANLRQLLKSEPFDIVQFSGLELGGYLDLILAETSDTKVVYDALNAEAELQRVIATVDRESLSRLPAALYSSIQARRLNRFERRICAGVDAVIAVSQEDRDHLWPHAGAPITVMSNGINFEDYRPPAESQRESQQLVFTGKDGLPAECRCGRMVLRGRITACAPTDARGSAQGRRQESTPAAASLGGGRRRVDWLG